MATAKDSGATLFRQCDITRKANALARKARVCEQCGIGFTEGKLSAKQIASGHRQRFCSIQCRSDSERVYPTSTDAKRAGQQRARARKGLPAVGSMRPCDVCGHQFAISGIKSRFCSDACARIWHEQERVMHEQASFVPRTFKCQECEQEHTTQYGSPSTVFCSAECSKRSFKRARRKVERARLRGASVETVNPTKVFNRDGWRCHMCGQKTPRRLRGTIDPRSPELDHIVPLAKGGDHSYRNTACACRRCNAAKSDTIKGQMLLFG